MSYTIRSLLELPLVVQDNILENLERAALASVSRTCRSLHRGALKYLYRNLIMDDCGWGASSTGGILIERSLRRNVTLIPYIRSCRTITPFYNGCIRKRIHLG